MEKNIINKNLILYSIKNLYKLEEFLILISINLGWILFPLKVNNNKKLEPILFGYNRLYKFFFKLKGFGFKWKYNLNLQKHKQTIYLKLGFTHRLALITKNNSKYKLKKKRLIIRNRSYSYLRHNLYLLFFLYKTYLYNKKGIYLRGTKFKLKISKKKSKF